MATTKEGDGNNKREVVGNIKREEDVYNYREEDGN